MTKLFGPFLILAVASSTFLMNSCSESSSSSGSFSSSTVLKSSNLSVSAFASTPHSSVSAKAATVKSAVSGLNVATTPCPTGTTTCYSPAAMGGKFSGFSLRIGTSGVYTRLEVITPVEEEIITSSDLKTFDLGSPSALTGTPSVDGVSVTGDTVYKDLIWTIGWIDVQFAANTFNSVGAATLRLVYFDDSVTGYRKGDILIKDGSDYKWCPTGTTNISSCSTTRPGSPITQNAGIVNYTPDAGSPDFPYLSAEISDSAAGTGVVLARAEHLTGSTSYTVDFDHEDVFAIEDATPGPFANIFEVMPLLYIRGLSATPTGVSVTGGLGAVLTVE